MVISSAEYQDLARSATSWRDVFKARLVFWPDLECETSGPQKGWFVAKQDSFAPMSSRNFWVISKQYYALAWSLFTLGHPNPVLMPYRDNVSNHEDAEHQLELRNIISNHGWGFVHFVGLAHLSCELGLKSILLHGCIELGMRPGFPRMHDLEGIFEGLCPEAKVDIRSGFASWSASHSPAELGAVLRGSGKRFNLQRYGDLPEANPEQLGVIDLSRYLHSCIE